MGELAVLVTAGALWLVVAVFGCCLGRTAGHSDEAAAALFADYARRVHRARRT